MADKTFGVKVSEELYDQVKDMIEASGTSAKEWFEKAVALTEMNAIKQGATDYSQDLSELEVHTTRIYELVSNMIQRSIYIKDHEVKEYADKLLMYETMINEARHEAAAAEEEAKESKELSVRLEKEKEALMKQLDEARRVNLNNQLLISEYKEKNDTLSGLVSKYQAFADENEKLKEQYSRDRERFESALQEITNQSEDQQDEIKELNQQIEMMKRDHEIVVERLAEKKDYEKERALLECERSYQDKLLKANEEYNAKIKELYDEISNIRKEYEGRIAELQAQLKSVQEPGKKKE